MADRVSGWIVFERDDVFRRRWSSRVRRSRGYGRWGYGSHPVLNEYILAHRCRRIMEIGVANGDNARTMVTVASQHSPISDIEYYGFDFFGWNDDFYLKQVAEKLKATGCLFTLFRGDSTLTLPQHVNTLPQMDLIFIDGGHSYATAKSDWDHSKVLMHRQTAVFFHNYEFPGVREVIDDISRQQFVVEIIDPPADSRMALVRIVS